MPTTEKRTDDVWRVSVADVANAAGLSEAEWLETVGPYVAPRFRHGGEYTDLLLLFAETTFELSCRFGDDRLTQDALRVMAPRLAEVWQDAKHAGHLRPVEIVVQHEGADAMRFELGAVARAMAHFTGDDAAAAESLTRLMDTVKQQRKDGTYDRLAAIADTLPAVVAPRRRRSKKK